MRDIRINHADHYCCGEVSYEDDVAHNLELIVNKLRGAEAEITVASYDSYRAA